MTNKSILITGGTGTFGKAFIEHCIETNAYNRIVIFSRDEYKQHGLKNKLNLKYGETLVESVFRFFIGDVRDRQRLQIALRGIDEVVHAAALKHVSFCEYNPDEALKTNVIGTRNVCDAAIEEVVKKVIFLSTDKAVEPINFYGSTKMLAEKYSVYSNNHSKNIAGSTKKRTKIACVRYGNVIGSRGSIVEVFSKMKNQDHFTITDMSMTRFWMDISDCVEMVSWALTSTMGGEIVIPKICASKVSDIAQAMDSEKDIKITGVRPGEKIHEQLLNRRESERTYDVGKFYIVLPEKIDWDNAIESYYSSFDKISRKKYFSNDKDLQMTMSDIKKIVSREENDQ